MGALEWLKLQIARYGPTGSVRASGLSLASLSEVGTDCYVGHAVTVTPHGGTSNGRTLLRMGDRVAVGPNVTFVCASNPESSSLSERYGGVESISIGDDVWIGADATILGGVEIGAESIVGAGAVVTDDVAARTVVGGVPARKLTDVA